MQFRDYQIELATTTITNRRNLNLLNIAPTGSGKTITFCLLILKAIELKASIRIVVLVDTVLLVDQNKKQFLDIHTRKLCHEMLRATTKLGKSYDR